MTMNEAKHSLRENDHFIVKHKSTLDQQSL